MVKPDDAFARRDRSNVHTGLNYDRWYCSAYIGSVSLQIGKRYRELKFAPFVKLLKAKEKFLDGSAFCLWIVTLAALIAAGLAVGSTAATSVLERQKEVGLMKALGASNSLVGAFFLGEQLLLALFGGGLGYAIGVLLARWLSITVFGVIVSSANDHASRDARACNYCRNSVAVFFRCVAHRDLILRQF